MLSSVQNYGSIRQQTNGYHDVETGCAESATAQNRLVAISQIQTPEGLTLDPSATASLTHDMPSLRDGSLSPIFCCVTPVMAGMYSASGAITGSLGATTLNLLGFERFGSTVGQIAKQGAVGGAVIGGSIGSLISCCLCVGAALADGEGSASVGSSSFMSGIVLSAASNAIGNVILTSVGDDTTSQLDGLAASGTGTVAIGVLGVALSCVLCVCAFSLAAGAAAASR